MIVVVAGAVSFLASNSSEETVIPLAARQWTVVKHWDGEDVRGTQKFEIRGDLWRLKWNASEHFNNRGFIEILVYEAAGRLVTLAGNDTTPATGEWYIDERGKFNLVIRSNVKWNVTVEESTTER